MANALAFSTPGRDVLSSIAGRSGAPAKIRAALNSDANARATAKDFESVFLNTMFSQMTTGMDGDGPFGGGPAVGVWRSMLTQEYAKSFASKGGIGIADHVYRSLIALQGAAPR